jgi:ribosomal protein S18 acetylase RimI-like enzyme
MNINILSLEEVVTGNYRLEDFIDIENNLHDLQGNIYGNDCWTLENFLNPLPSKLHLSKICVSDKKIIGFSIVYLYSTDWAHISRVGIDPKNQGLGYGKKMLLLQMDSLNDLKIKMCTIDVKSENGKAIHLYNNLGFLKFTEKYLQKYVRLRNRVEQEYLDSESIYTAMYKNFCQLSSGDLLFHFLGHE